MSAAADERDARDALNARVRALRDAGWTRSAGTSGTTSPVWRDEASPAGAPWPAK